MREQTDPPGALPIGVLPHQHKPLTVLGRAVLLRQWRAHHIVSFEPGHGGHRPRTIRGPDLRFVDGLAVVS